MFAADALPYPHMRALYDALQTLTGDDLARRAAARDRSYQDQGVTFSHAGEEWVFPLDLIPRLIPAAEWELVEAGVVQRVRALEAFLADVLGYDESTSVSIVGALVGAWQNARSAREALSAEIWESLNSTHNSLPGRVTAARDFGPAPFFSHVRERAASFAGYVEAGMSRDASYDVLVLGRSLERVDMTARLLAARIGAGRGAEGWTSTLRACSAQEAYVRNVEASRVLEFLLVDRLFPRSIFHALRAGEDALARLDPASGRSTLDEPARRAIGRARTNLEFLSAASLLDDLPERLLGLQRTVSTVSEAVTRRLFAGSPPLHWSIEEDVG